MTLAGYRAGALTKSRSQPFDLTALRAAACNQAAFRLIYVGVALNRAQ
jgi:hypothetical protein